MEICSRRMKKGTTSMKLEIEGERRKQGRTNDREDNVLCNDGERKDLRCLVEGEMGEDSSGTEYEPDNEDEGVSESVSLLVSEYSVDEGCTDRIGGDEGRCTSAVREGASGGQCRGQIVDLDGDEVRTDVGTMVRDHMVEWEREEMVTRLPGRSRKKRRFFRNYVSAMVALCEENKEDDRVRLSVRIYAFTIMSGVLFPGAPYGVAWGMLQYVEDIQRIGEYNWAEAVWRVVVNTIEDTQKKLCAGPLTEVQLNGFCLLIQGWFYEHTIRFVDQGRKRYPCIASWVRVGYRGRCDASELVKDITEEEVIPILCPRDVELVDRTVSQFMATDEFGYYIDDGEGWLSVDERLRMGLCLYVMEDCTHLPLKGSIHFYLGSHGTPTEGGSDSTAEDSQCHCSKCSMAFTCHCGVEAKLVEHHDNYHQTYACCPKRDDIACAYFHELDPPYPQKAMDVIDDLVAQNRELHNLLIDERNNHYCIQSEDMAVDNAVRAELARMKVMLRFARAMIVPLGAIVVRAVFR
ncbi:hypothetical protein Cgig2_028557 [Carnegiea gigantea]|uniref:Uncharacterized protein n=1 Tax=Carnegiea gigantea TaxID=171969 RepID=A0A9Q1GKD2_9CARY|nr:hypothetical protein Cgig2_028557 [Carnegiea gigantea]